MSTLPNPASSVEASIDATPFFTVRDVPANSVLLMHTREAAQAVPRGTLELVMDPSSGLVYNRAFDERLTEYSKEYESTQSHSPTFNAFHRRLAKDLIERHGLNGGTVLEIGCGNGEFLALLAELADVHAVGFDPAFNAERAGTLPDSVIIVPDLFTDATPGYDADLVACKMTLEHIPDPDAFLGMVRRAIGDRTDTVVFVQIPEARQLFREGAFWDFYYEHCSYFSPGAIARIFRRQGFDVVNLWTDYGDQYLMIEARPATSESASDPLEAEESLATIRQEVAAFADDAAENVAAWQTLVDRTRETGARIALWGGSSKTVGFVTALERSGDVAAVVDVNPNKHDTYLPGSGLHVVAPSALREVRPDVVLIMNPVYRNEIERDLRALDVAPVVWTLHGDPTSLPIPSQ